MRFLSLVLLFCLGLRAQQAGIEGVAIDAVTRQPMAGVHITLRTAENPENADVGDIYGAISLADGHFSIANLKPGVYYATAQHNGYIQLHPKTFALKAGDLTHDITVELTRHAVIVGHVLDEFGDPVQRVQILAQSATTGTRGSEGFIRTDERGQFRLALPPGKYYVQAQAAQESRGFMGGGPEIRTDGSVPSVYGTTFYPNAATSDKATAVELAPGQNLSGIDIHLTPKQSVIIRGKVTGMPEKPFGAPAYISLISVSTSGAGFNQPAFTLPDGTFAFTALAPGKYSLMAHYQAADAPAMQSASVDVDAETDASNVVLALASGETLAGTVEFEGEKPKPGAREKLGVRLNPEIRFGANQGADVDDNGAFHIDGVFPGKVHLSVMPLPENTFVKSIKMGTAETQDGSIDLSRGVAGTEIRVRLSRNGAHVEGKVLGEDGQPFADAVLVVLKDSPDAVNEEGIKLLEPGEKFSYAGLHPGRYRMLALDPAQFMGGQDGPNALKALLAHAEEIEIHEGDKITKDIKISAKQ